ncbi:MAG: hypothetical protein ACJ78Q_03365 [Chloroflexia bacterium]
MTPDQEGEDREYQDMLALEDLESMLEELEELKLPGISPGQDIPERLRERMEDAGVKNIQQIRERIMRLNAALDDSADDLTITES